MDKRIKFKRWLCIYEERNYPTCKSVRGGAYDWTDATPCYYRIDAMPIDTYTGFGFRPALILQ